ncbi:MAG: hypothetical protein M3358_13565 [Actinomycetota bacterium]|nr:hypothetical protein [Actinomycetota bacterium]
MDLVDDPSVLTLCRSDGKLVARSTRASDAGEIRRAAEEDSEGGGGGASIHPID